VWADGIGGTHGAPSYQSGRLKQVFRFLKRRASVPPTATDDPPHGA
jgi:hypothetical protein